MNQIIKLSMVVAVATLMTACGGSSEESEKGIISSGGKCIKIPIYRKMHKKSTSKVVTTKGDIGEYFMSTESLESSINSYKGYQTSRGITTYFDHKFYVKNNYQHTTKSEFKRMLANGEVMDKSIFSFDPYFIREASGKACKGQSWIDSYKELIKITDSTGKESTLKKKGKSIATIEDINILKTVEAGEFSTFISIREFTVNGQTRKSRFWIDIETGQEVYSESYEDGKLISTIELIELTR